MMCGARRTGQRLADKDGVFITGSHRIDAALLPPARV